MTVELVSPGRWPLNALGLSGEPLTTGIEKRLPWLVNLRGSLADPEGRTSIRTSNELAATLGRFDLVQGRR